MRPLLRLAAAGLVLVAVQGPARADEPMQGSFRAGRACDALVSIRKDTNPGRVITGPGLSYQLLAANQKKNPTHYRIVIPDANPPERWVEAACGKAMKPPQASADASAKPAQAARPVDRSYVLALSWQPAFCETNQKKPECRWQTGRRHDASYLSLHGLWPQPSTTAYCNLPAEVRAASEGGRWKDIPDIDLRLSTRAELETMMPGTMSFLERHEWAKHGSCYPADAEAYFADSIRLLKAVNASPVADLLMRSVGRRVTTADIRAAFDQGFGKGAGDRVRVACKDDGSRRLIAELTIGLKGDIPGGDSLPDLMMASGPVDPGCPAGFLDPVGPQ